MMLSVKCPFCATSVSLENDNVIQLINSYTHKMFVGITIIQKAVIGYKRYLKNLESTEALL